MGNSASLLPPNARALEHALAAATARLGDIPRPLPELWRPDAIPLAILPWLAWGLALDRWRQAWSEAQKRAATANAIPDARQKGSRGAAMAVLADYDPRLTMVEWWEEGGSGAPYTFTVIHPLDGAGGPRASAAFAASLYADLLRVKPARAHFELRQRLAARAALPVAAALRSLRLERRRAAMTGPDPADDLKLQTEYGEPLEGGEGLALEDH